MTNREYQWKRFVRNYNIEVPQDKVEQEIYLIRMDLRHRMQYDTLTTGTMHFFPDEELDEQMDDIRDAALFEVKSTLVMKDILKMQDFPVTREELEAEAEAMAKRQNTTVELIKGFFGEDLTMLERDVRERKAMDWAFANLVK